MSIPFICDTCGELFSQNESGWRAMSMSLSDSDHPNNAPRTQLQHMCGPCVIRNDERLKARRQITTTVED